jgi:polysaccharide deacetylase family protein (PEP-CTERM system associated)
MTHQLLSPEVSGRPQRSRAPDESDARVLPKRTHVMSVDVEDYFMVEAFSGSVPRHPWDTWPSRVLANTERLLDLFDKYNVKATFFFVGWVAKKFPRLVRDTHARGHELATHSYWHRPVYSLTPEQFREDTHAASCAIEDASGTKVNGYRAPSWSITKESLWALDILSEQGYTYDSSIFPIHHDLYGLPGAKRFPYRLVCSNGQTLEEFPPASVKCLGVVLPGGGGGYLRILPMAYTRWVFREFERKYQERVVVYVHPWELDPAHPRIKDRLKSRLRHYTNLSKMQARLEFLCQHYSFARFCDIVTQSNAKPDERLSFACAFQTRVPPK